ncbi:BON domain-containing protein [Burkholderia sp. BCC0405]|uniref:BON domain-containing protein n=1 Tax=Burkholderia sp. BCC0405 TaxID=2676298 RepID=UPI001588BC45|nr:BON domain-containing protein [Burkholderia sp. BCC0405]
MNIFRIICGVASVLLIAANTPVLAQVGSGAATNPASTSSSIAPSPGVTRAANRELCRAVRKQLVKERRLDLQNVATICHDGVVTLAGTVPFQREIDLAEKVVGQVDGVVSVKNALVVRSIGD